MMVDNHNCVLEPEGFLEVITKLTDRFEVGRQEDAQEFLIYLLDMVHEDLNRVDKTSKTEVKEIVKSTNLTQSEMETSAKLAWKNHLLDNKSIIVDIFQGQIKSMIRCMNCNTTSTTFDPVMYFSLPFPESLEKDEDISVEELFKEYSRIEKLDLKMDCKLCEKKTVYEKKIDLWKSPNILIIHLKRFKFEKTGGATKISNGVDFKIRNFDITDHVIGFQRVKAIYNLFAVCVGWVLT